jgi:branched-subunit amino acid ABC-type transport system permease component
MELPSWFLQVLSGLTYGALAFLVASGLTLTFGALRLLNLAHGSFYMLGGYVAYTLSGVFAGLFGQGGFFAALLLAPLVIAAIGSLAEMGLFRNIYRSEELYQVVLTFALLLIVNDAVKLIWGPSYYRVPMPDAFAGIVLIGNLPFPRYFLLIWGVAPIIVLGLWFLLYRTRAGRLIRAVVQDREMAAALGINVSRIFTSVFTLGCWLAGLGGVLIAPMVSVDLSMDLTMLLMAFIVVVIGGLGSFSGALVGALILGQAQAFGVVVLPRFVMVLPFALMALILIVRPQGLFGEVET